MEISSFFHLSVRRVVALVVVGGIAAAIGAAVASRSPREYQGSAVILTAQVMEPGFPQYSLQPIVDSLQTLVFADSVVNKAAKASGEPAAQIGNNISTDINGASNVVVHYTSTNPAAIPVVLKTIGHQSLRALGQTAVDSAKLVLDQSQKELDKATTALANYEATSGTSDTPRHQELADVVSRDRDERDSANGDLSKAQAQITRSTSPSIVAVQGPSPKSRTSDIARAAATAGVAAVALLLLIMFLVDWRNSRDDQLVREARRRAADYEPDDMFGDSLASARDRAATRARS